MSTSSAVHGLKGRPKSEKPKHMKAVHVHQMHDGKLHVALHSGKPGEPPQESAVNSTSDAAAAMEQHMGTENPGEAQMQGQPTGPSAPAGGAPPAAPEPEAGE